MIKLYFHHGCGNHGCEAIVRATAALLEKPVTLYSGDPADDYRYHVEEAVSIRHNVEDLPSRGSLSWLRCAVNHKLTGTDYQFNLYKYRTLLRELQRGDVFLSVGGDNYCYSGIDVLMDVNKGINDKQGKTVLWGCSVEPELLQDPAVVRDMKCYSLITARETLTYEALLAAGVEKALLCPDPAFTLQQASSALQLNPEKQYVGINVSPLAMEAGDGVFANYERLAQFILKETPYHILLIPHVVWPTGDDRIPLSKLATSLGSPDRVTLVEDQTCEQLKSLIAQCRFFIGARTHASIAAYSTCVPTLVTGYSVKAKGIARDIFGTWEHFVVPVQELQGENNLTEAFQWLQANEAAVRSHLQEFVPAYCEKARLGAEAVKRLASC